MKINAVNFDVDLDMLGGHTGDNLSTTTLSVVCTFDDTSYEKTVRDETNLIDGHTNAGPLFVLAHRVL